MEVRGPWGYHMSPDEFREWGHRAVEWIARYMEEVEKYPVLSQVSPGEVRRKLAEHPPQTGEGFDRIFHDLETIILPGLTHWQSPKFFAFFPANTSGPSILGELISAGLGIQGMLWSTSPSCTELETHVLDWVAEMLDLPEKFKSYSYGGGVIQDSASSAVLCAMIAARERVTGGISNLSGCDGSLVAYASNQAHSSVEKAAGIAGIGRRNLRLVEVDESFSMDPEALRQAIREDRSRGKKPFFVCATVGTTSSNAIDPVEEIGRICAEEGLWLHVDGAMSGTAAICPEFRYIHRGLEYADSYCFNPHKWMFTNFDCDCMFVADRTQLISALTIMPEYLKNRMTETGAVIDYRDWQIPLGRRFRALKLWFVIRHYGVEGLRFHIRRHVELAQEFASWVQQDDEFELVVRPPLNLVCFRHKGGDEITQRILDLVNRRGRIYITHTRLHDKLVLRLCVGQTHTEFRHVKEAFEELKKAARLLTTENVVT